MGTLRQILSVNSRESAGADGCTGPATSKVCAGGHKRARILITEARGYRARGKGFTGEGGIGGGSGWQGSLVEAPGCLTYNYS